MVNTLAEQVSEQIGCSVRFARDLLVLAGGDADLVVQASIEAEEVGHLKALVIDKRFKKERENQNEV